MRRIAAAEYGGLYVICSVNAAVYLHSLEPERVLLCMPITEVALFNNR